MIRMKKFSKLFLTESFLISFVSNIDLKEKKSERIGTAPDQVTCHPFSSTPFRERERGTSHRNSNTKDFFAFVETDYCLSGELVIFITRLEERQFREITIASIDFSNKKAGACCYCWIEPQHLSVLLSSLLLLSSQETTFNPIQFNIQYSIRLDRQLCCLF
ncbi:hypothetical protein DFA_01162 [Cavenderia fasciculata]|uniref:Uncharacterized protein n=1 Tax=Cavenderia fasciculata TaxID=261658 RepID=F4PR81_CACFS|nr:uncharacterized protein DFA_01162 [Cavenderia fasciculata]EGG21281.1 hypothetical protein DFA_01162 [Cavenderia fasciculata]|eukprot:XP_004359131.1 hypothetical protein DFA_01162 [Cavenderia fasciculata]